WRRVTRSRMTGSADSPAGAPRARERTRSLRRRAIAAVLALTVLAVGGVVVEHVGASAIAYAPNAGQPPNPAFDPTPPAGTRPMRVAVGPPAASIATLVLEPPAPRATVFVLHGIRDRKESNVGWGRR